VKFTYTDISTALEETTKDLMVFRTAFNTLQRRITESSDAGNDGPISLIGWAGTDAVMGSLTLALTAIEHRREELLALRNRLSPGDAIEITE